MPVGVLTGRGIAQAANGVSRAEVEAAGNELLDRVASEAPAPTEFAFPHVGITEAAFPGAHGGRDSQGETVHCPQG